LIDSLQWKSIEPSGGLLCDPTSKQLFGVSWQNLGREEVKKKSRQSSGEIFDYNYPGNVSYISVMLGGGDMTW
jgi:hypothetical protein